MLASALEFRHRTWFIFGILCVGLACYWLDPQNSGVVLATVLRIQIGSLQAHSLRSSIRGVLLVGALIVVTEAMIRTWGEASEQMLCMIRACVPNGSLLTGRFATRGIRFTSGLWSVCVAQVFCVAAPGGSYRCRLRFCFATD